MLIFILILSFSILHFNSVISGLIGYLFFNLCPDHSKLALICLIKFIKTFDKFWKAIKLYVDFNFKLRNADLI